MTFSLKNSIFTARTTFGHLKNDDLATSIGNIWSIKKMMLLNYYMPAFSKIVLHNNFKQCYFADPFCGSGIFAKFKDKELENEIFPGSPLIGALNASKYNYHDCIFSENNQKNIDALNKRLRKCNNVFNNKNYSSKKLNFDEAVANILKIKKFGVAILVLIDPAGYKDIKWSLIEKLIKAEKGIDIIFNFYTQGIVQNVSTSSTKPEYEKNLDEFFGNNEWQTIRNKTHSQILGDRLLHMYLSKINANYDKVAKSLAVFKKGEQKLYDLILITGSKGGINVFEGAKKIMDKITTENIKNEFKVQIGNQTRISDHFNL